jgi:hypothetical protein
MFFAALLLHFYLVQVSGFARRGAISDALPASIDAEPGQVTSESAWLDPKASIN